MIKILVFVFIFIKVISAQKYSCVKEGKKNDPVLNDLILFGSPTRKYPTNPTELKAFCTENKSLNSRFKTFTDKCLDKNAKTISNLLMYSINKANTNICKSKRKSADFINSGKCGNDGKADSYKCWNNLVRMGNAVKDISDHKIKIPLMCCSAFKLIACVQESHEKHPKNCNSKAIEELDKLVRGYTTDTLSLMCGDYTEDSDKCDTLADKYPKPSNKKRLSLVKVFINFFASLPDVTF